MNTERFKSERDELDKIRIRGNELSTFIERAKEEIGGRFDYIYRYGATALSTWEADPGEAQSIAEGDFREAAVFAKKPIEESEKIRLFKEFRETQDSWRWVSESEAEILLRIVGEILREMIICSKCGKEMTFLAGERRYCMEDITLEELDVIIASLERRIKQADEHPDRSTYDDFGAICVEPDRPIVQLGSLKSGWEKVLKDLKRKRELKAGPLNP